VWVRDIISAIKISHLKNDYNTNFLGVDCSLLINPHSIFKKKEKKISEKRIGIFLGRTINYSSKILSFTFEIANRIKYSYNWINWGDSKAFPSLNNLNIKEIETSINGFDLNGNQDTEKTLLNLLDYSLIITDTYHLCVNSWNLGIPAICFYGIDYMKIKDVNYGNIYTRNDKRHLFYSMYDALDFLISYDELINEELIEGRIRHIQSLLNIDNFTNEITSRIRNHSNSAEHAFIKSFI
jgi:hypothetical protein